MQAVSAPKCEKCGGEKDFIPGHLATIGWRCFACEKPQEGVVATVIQSEFATQKQAPRCEQCGFAKHLFPTGWGCEACRPKDVVDESGATPAAEPEPPKPPDETAQALYVATRRSAKIPEGLPQNAPVLRAWAQASGVSARYFGCPVYLVGGALRDADPRDVDLIVAMPDDLFVNSYGENPWRVGGVRDELDAWETSKGDANPAPIWRRWARDCAKQSAVLTKTCGRAVDFKVQPQRAFDAYATQPRIRLDCAFMPEETSQ